MGLVGKLQGLVGMLTVNDVSRQLAPAVQVKLEGETVARPSSLWHQQGRCSQMTGSCKDPSRIKPQCSVLCRDPLCCGGKVGLMLLFGLF